MPDSEPPAGQDEHEDELTITALRPLHAHAARPRLILGLSLVLLVAVLLVAMLRGAQQHDREISSASPAPSPTAMALPSTPTVSAALPPTPAPPVVAPTPLPSVVGTPTLDPAPASCVASPPALTPGGPPHWGWSVGHAPVLLGGFIGPYATMPLGSAASSMAYSWAAPYTLYGWPAPIGLVLQSGYGGGPVTLTGWDARTGYPLWFGFITAGDWGAPQRVVTTFTLDPAHPSVPVGGWTSGEKFWYGYAFLPGAGCYVLAATWPGGGWQVTVSAGMISPGSAGQ